MFIATVKPGFHIVAAVARIFEIGLSSPSDFMETNGSILLATLSDLGDPVAGIAEVLSQRPSAIHSRVYSRKSLNEIS